MNLLFGLILFAAASASSVRWLRVCQREHYLPGATTRFATRWMASSPVNAVLYAALVVTAIVGIGLPPLWLATAALLIVWPVGLGLRGRTSKLNWTRRLRTLAAIAGGLAVVVLAAAALVGGWTVGVAIVALFGPVLVDLASAIARPIENRLLGRFVTAAQQRVKQVDPETIAITGSFGKTSTKEYLRALLAEQFEVVASPASFNNLAGLARTVNEHLHPGAELFIAEMGTYGPGEIRQLCAWLRPRISVITAIGPVHLERMGSLDGVLAAKREILDTAEVAVLNVDDPRLAVLADDVAGSLRVVRCGSTAPVVDVRVEAPGPDGRAGIDVGDERLEVDLPAGIHVTNLACAIGAATAAGLLVAKLPAGIAALRAPAHRCTVETTGSGVTVVDDTYNANPSGARAALDVLAGLPGEGRRVVVTPGMVELGPVQDTENAAFAGAAIAVADTLIVVGGTNRRALLRGANGAANDVRTVPTREEAVAWVRANLGAGDAVLYENDLPDHFP